MSQVIALPHDARGGLNGAELARDARREQRRMFALCSPAVLLVGLLLCLPVGWLFWLSLLDPGGVFTVENYTRMLGSISYLRTFQTTFEIAFVVTAVTVLLGYPLAYCLSQLPPRAAGFAMAFVILPFWTSLLVRTYAWLVLLQRRGVINTWLTGLGVIQEPLPLVHNFLGTTIGMTHILLPFLVLPLYAAMTAIDRDLLRAAANCGASPTQAFWRVFFPLSLPGLFAGVVLVFVLCLGFYITPELLGGGKVLMWAVRIEKSVNLYTNWGAASALGVVLLVAALGLLYLLNRLFRLDRMLLEARG
jgi:putative spermidine/putrescine transport system permease protein/spermidine/putrescine transport system permease protein